MHSYPTLAYPLVSQALSLLCLAPQVPAYSAKKPSLSSHRTSPLSRFVVALLWLGPHLDPYTHQQSLSDNLFCLSRYFKRGEIHFLSPLTLSIDRSLVLLTPSAILLNLDLAHHSYCESLSL